MRAGLAWDWPAAVIGLARGGESGGRPAAPRGARKGQSAKGGARARGGRAARARGLAFAGGRARGQGRGARGAGRERVRRMKAAAASEGPARQQSTGYTHTHVQSCAHTRGGHHHRSARRGVEERGIDQGACFFFGAKLQRTTAGQQTDCIADATKCGLSNRGPRIGAIPKAGGGRGRRGRRGPSLARPAAAAAPCARARVRGEVMQETERALFGGRSFGPLGGAEGAWRPGPGWFLCGPRAAGGAGWHPSQFVRGERVPRVTGRGSVGRKTPCECCASRIKYEAARGPRSRESARPGAPRASAAARRAAARSGGPRGGGADVSAQ